MYAFKHKESFVCPIQLILEDIHGKFLGLTLLKANNNNINFF